MSVAFGHTEWAWYDVHGYTLAAVADAIAQLAEAGTAEWFPHYVYDDDGAVITSATVTVETRVTLPAWSEHGSAAPAEQAEWDRYAAALLAHEQGHLALVQEHLEAVDTHLVGFSPDEGGNNWQLVLQGLQAASDAFDAETDYGRNTGAVIEAVVGESDPTGVQ